MRVGSLVRNNLYGSVGVVLQVETEWVYVAWLKKPSLEVLAHPDDLEVICS